MLSGTDEGRWVREERAVPDLASDALPDPEKTASLWTSVSM